MTVFVVLEFHKGLISKVQVFLTPESAEKEKQQWLKEHYIKNKIDLECKAQNGNELIVEECSLLP